LSVFHGSCMEPPLERRVSGERGEKIIAEIAEGR
jgi:hypothetical protein